LRWDNISVTIVLSGHWTKDEITKVANSWNKPESDLTNEQLTEILPAVGGRQPSKTPTISWAKMVIMHLWTYSITLWKIRNGVVHGHTLEARKAQEFTALQARILSGK
jgi:hypothetical protein